jgi:hypothetical protein
VISVDRVSLQTWAMMLVPLTILALLLVGAIVQTDCATMPMAASNIMLPAERNNMRWAPGRVKKPGLLFSEL